MKKALFLVAFTLLSTVSFAQWTVSYHQSSIPFAGVNHQFGERFIPEFRLGTDVFFDNLNAELVANYMFVKTDDYQFYGGLGGRVGVYEGLVIPVGLNLYPFEQKKFGFQMEIAGLIGNSEVLRGSLGIRYRFGTD